MVNKFDIKSAFIAYRHTGEEPEVLEPMLTAVRDELGRIGVEAYCTFFDEKEFHDKSLSPRQIMEHAFATIEKKDLLYVVQAKSEKSEGMILEVGKFFGIKPIIVAKHRNVQNTYLPDMADITYEWDTVDNLIAGIQPSVEQLP